MPDLSSATLWKPSPPPLSHILSHINKHTHTMCPVPPEPSSPLEHERRGHKAGSGKQSPARPAPGEGGQAPPAAGQVSLFSFHVFFFPTFSLWFVSFGSLFSLSHYAAHLFRPLFVLHPLSTTSLPFCPHPPSRMSNARLASHPQCLIPPCGSSLPSAARFPSMRKPPVIMHALISQPNKEVPVNDCCAHTWVSSVSCGVLLLMRAADQSSVLIVWVPREGPFWPMTLKPTQHHSGLWATIPNELHLLQHQQRYIVGNVQL